MWSLSSFLILDPFGSNRPHARGVFSLKPFLARLQRGVVLRYNAVVRSLLIPTASTSRLFPDTFEVLDLDNTGVGFPVACAADDLEFVFSLDRNDYALNHPYNPAVRDVYALFGKMEAVPVKAPLPNDAEGSDYEFGGLDDELFMNLGYRDDNLPSLMEERVEFNYGAPLHAGRGRINHPEAYGSLPAADSPYCSSLTSLPSESFGSDSFGSDTLHSGSESRGSLSAPSSGSFSGSLPTRGLFGCPPPVSYPQPVSGGFSVPAKRPRDGEPVYAVKMVQPGLQGYPSQERLDVPHPPYFNPLARPSGAIYVKLETSPEPLSLATSGPRPLFNHREPAVKRQSFSHQERGQRDQEYGRTLNPPAALHPGQLRPESHPFVHHTSHGPMQHSLIYTLRTVPPPGDSPASTSYACPMCSSSFKVKGYLTRHMKKHNEAKAFVCPFYFDQAQHGAGSKCHPSGGFSRKDTYKTHLKALHFIYPPGTKSSHRSEVGGRCAGCFAFFANNTDWLEEHMEKLKCPGVVLEEPVPVDAS